MALKDMKSDLSKFRVPKSKPLESKPRVDVNKNANKTPLSSMTESAPKIPRSTTTVNKEGVNPQKVNQTEKFKGETTPQPMDNSEKFKGETTPNVTTTVEKFKGETTPTPMSLVERYLGETNPTDMDNSSKFLGETTPKEADNNSKFLGETTPKESDNNSQFLGETTPKEASNQSQFLGETTPKEANNQSQFLGETTPKEANNQSQFLGETTPNESDNSSKFLGETTPTPMSLEERYLGQTTPSESDKNSKFLGETTPNESDRSSKFLGETTPLSSDRSSKFLGETTPSEMPKSTGESFLGETTNKFVIQGDKDKGETTPSPYTFSTKFLGETTSNPMIIPNGEKGLGETTPINVTQGDKPKGETTPNDFAFNKKLENEGKEYKEVNYQTDIHSLGFNSKFGGVEASRFVGVNPNNTVFDGASSLYSNQSDNSFKVGGTYGESFNTAAGLNSGQEGFGLGKGHAKRKSPSFLDEQYSKFNLREDAHNAGLGLFRQPFILRGIQRKKISKGEPQVWGLGGFNYDEGAIRGGIVTSTVRALVDIVRIGKWFASIPGILWGAKQFGLQRSQKFGKIWTPVGMLAAIGGQHIGLKAQRPGLIPLVDSTFQYQDNTLNIVKDKLLTIYNVDMLAGLSPGLIPKGMPFASQLDIKGGFNSLYGINIMGPGLTTRGDNTFSNPSVFGPYSANILNKTQTEYVNDGDKGTSLAIKNTKISLATIQNKFRKGRKVEIKTSAGDVTIQNNPFEKEINTLGESHNINLLDKGELIRTYETIAYGDIPKRIAGDTELNDFRSLLKGSEKDKAKNENYAESNLTTRFGFGNPGAIGADRTDRNVSTPNGADLVNKADIGAPIQEDLVPLVFYPTDNAGAVVPSKHIQFRGTVSGITDNFSPGWEGFKYNGRADSAYKYGTFSRDVSFAFSVYPTTKVELEPLYKKLERLSTMTMPKYGTAGYQGMLIRFTLGKMWNQHLALIDSLAYSYSDEVPWDIEAGASMGVDVSIGLKILSDTLPEYETYPVYDLGFGE